MATSTITGLTAVLAGNLTDNAVVVLDDSAGNTRKATIAQLRTQLSAGNQTFSGTVTIGGGLSITASVDNRMRLGFYMGGDNAQGIRFDTGVYVPGPRVFGFQGVQLFATQDNSQLASFTNSGAAIGSPSSMAGASRGDVVIPNGSFYRASNPAGTAAVALMRLRTTNEVELNLNGVDFHLSNAAISGTAGGVAGFINVVVGGSARRIPFHTI